MPATGARTLPAAVTLVGQLRAGTDRSRKKTGSETRSFRGPEGCERGIYRVRVTGFAPPH